MGIIDDVMMLKKIDWPVFFLALALSVIGLLVINSLSKEYFQQQLIALLVGLIFFLIFAQIDFVIWQQFFWPIYFAINLLLLSTLIFGETVRGATRWIDFGLWKLQPSEIIKPFLIIFLATFLTKQRDYLTERIRQIDLKQIIFYVFTFLPPFFLVFRQPDFGSAVIIGAVWFILLLVSPLKFYWLVLLTIFVGVSFLPAQYLLAPYQRQRLQTFINPQFDPLGVSYNVIQSIIAVGSGGLLGRGFGRGTQTHLQFLPENHTDFIFASLTEELGFFGACLVIILFILLLLRLLYLSQKQTFFSAAQLSIIGFAAMIFLQMFVNISMNLGLLPIAGITLPFLSYGGSSLVSNWLALGIIAGLSQRLTRKETIKIV